MTARPINALHKSGHPCRWKVNVLRAGFALGVLMMAPCLSVADESAGPVELLRHHEIDTETSGVIAYLRRLQPDPERQREIAEVIARLSSPEFARREAATRTLATYAEEARIPLAEVMKSTDPEMRLRAGKILRRLDLDERSQWRKSLTLAALEVLRSRRDRQSTPVLLATLALLEDPPARDVAAEALWASADAGQSGILAAALDHSNIHVRAAAVVALEVCGGEAEVERIAPMLESDEAMIRLAAARALIDRMPRRAVETLVAIAGEEDQELVWQADALLQLKTGHRIQPGGNESIRAAWKKWLVEELADVNLDAPVGDRRLRRGGGRNTLDEGFDRDAKSLANGYGRFLYEADNGGGADVAGGRLRLDGDNPEGDQRLMMTSRRMIGSDRWPDRVEVRARMEGEPGNNFGWHLGISVGRVKVLFHPGLPGGGFRAETTDGHEYLFGNENMPFEPVTGVVHEMIISVTKTTFGADFEVTVKGGNGGAPHRKKFAVSDEQLGDFDRIGLERSGRTGGDALFDAVSVRLRP